MTTDPEGMITCSACSVENTSDSNFCRRCGARLPVHLDSPETTAGFAIRHEDDSPSQQLDYASVTGTVLQIHSHGDREGDIVALGGEEVTVGRSPQSDLFLDDVTVSRHHARILIDEDGYVIEDLNSLNGTYVNRKRIERHQLFDGDELQIGKFKLSFMQHDHAV